MNNDVPHICAMLSQLKRNLSTHEYPVTRISDNEEYLKAVDFNKNLYGGIHSISDTIDTLYNASKLQLSFVDIERTSLKEAILSINSKGVLQLTSHFLESIKLPIGTKLAPAANAADTNDKNIYFVEHKEGLRLTKNILSIEPILKKFNKAYPTKVFWDVLEYKHHRGFQLIFS